MGTFLRDLRHGARHLISQPLVSAAAIGSLALGIGLNVAIFSVVNAVLLRGQPLHEPDRLVEIYSGLSKDFPQLTSSYPDFQDIERGADVLQGLTGSSYVRGIITTGGRGALITGEAVTANYFDLLGIPLTHGRGFRADENLTPDAAPVIVVSHGLWQRSLGGAPSVIGQTVKISGLEYTVVGVASREFTGLLPGIAADFWVPLMMVERFVFSGMQATTDNDPGTTRLTRRGHRWLFVKGRLKDGRSVDEARAQIETLYARLRSAYPNTNKDVTASVVPASSVRFHPMLDGYFQAASGGLFAAVGLVLLIACGNVAGLLLARASARRREFAIRAAIGASRGRLIQQLLSESVILAGAGGAGGVLIAWWVTRLLQGLASTDVFPMRVAFDFSIDGSVLTFAAAASLVTAVVFGLAPAWSASKPELVPALKASAEGDERTRWSMRDVLVVGQLALSMVLLVIGALLGRGLLTAYATDLGYDPRPLSSLSFSLSMNGYDPPRATALHRRALDALTALPGVEGVSTASRLPLAPDINMDGFKIQGRHAPDEQDVPVDSVRVGVDYFATVGVPIVDGRAFTQDDVANERSVGIVNETFARQYWPGESAVGRRIHMNGFDDPPTEIVGVARDHKVRSVGEAPRPYLHMPDYGSTRYVVRTSTPPERALPMLRQALWSLEPGIVFTEDVPAQEVADTTVLPTRIGAMVLGAFGALALLLAAIGLYGVVAYSVSRRTREVGIRMALGAQRGDVLRTMAARGSRLAIIGLVIGGLLAAAAGSLLESMLYGVSAVDAIAFSAAAAVLLLVAGVANLIPAAGATRIDPIRALRSE
jgi:predicted permease